MKSTGKKTAKRIEIAAYKVAMLAAATAGCQKPNRGTREGRLLANCLSSDEAFKESIRTVRPEWFKDYYLKSYESILKEILDYAKENEERPKNCTEFGNKIKRLIQIPRARRAIKAIRPNWFQNTKQTDRTKYRKELLLNSAKMGFTKPKSGSALYRDYMRYIYSDDDFRKQIAVYNPNWMVNPRKKKADAMRASILRLARDGHKRPTRFTAEGKYLINFLRTDQEFRAELFSLRPDWFKGYKKGETRDKPRLRNKI
jgi:hypothetical protein